VVLVDTSVWIEVFRRGSSLALESVVDLDEVVTCGPVIQEVIQGFDDERAFRVARDSMVALPVLENPMTLHVYEQAAELYRRGRRAGKTVRSSVDCLIAACALLHDVEVLHCDRDYDAIATIAPLRARNVGRNRSTKKSGR
jgi:predicted nucleic acid-binding protein